MSLKIAKNLSLPDEAVTQTFGILAKRGVGKTYTASVMAEEMLKNNLPIVILDPIGVWWGLRSSANGKTAGLPIIIAGGDHADIPLDPSNGEIIANLVVNEKLPLVIDLSLFRKGEQIKFVTDFAETLYHRNRTALHLIIDEADAFAPQQPRPDTARMLGAMEDLVRRGRARGIGVTMITQRPSVLNKNVLTQIEVLIALRMTAPLDQKAIDDWIRTHAEEGQREEFMRSLPSLPVGTAWFWSPGWLDIFKKIEVRKRETLDSSSTPKIGKLKIEPRKMANVDLDKIRTSLAATIEKAEAEDPKVLKRRIIELERKLEIANKKQPEVKKVPILDKKQIDKLRTALKPVEEILRIIKPQIKIQPVLDLKTDPASHFNTNKILATSPPVKRVPKPEQIQISENEINLRAGERRILEVLARHYPMRFTRNQLGTLSRFSPRGGTFGTYFGTLKRNGLIEENGDVAITEAGLSYLGEVPRSPMTTDELLSMWRNALRAGERKMLDVLTNIYPRAITRDDLGAHTGFSAKGGTFGTYLGSLRRNGLIEVNGSEVRASDTLFVA